MPDTLVARRFRIVAAPQRSPEWFAARLGRVTGSRAADLLATIKSGEAAARRDYRLQLVVERLTGQPAEDAYVSTEMQRGIDLEPSARAAYESQTGEVVQESGFLAHETLMAGASLDGHVGDFEGLIELKCPKSATHARYLKTGEFREHLAQITHNLWLTGAAWCDFVSFDPRWPAALQLFVRRIHAADVDLAAHEAAVVKFLREVDLDEQAMRTLAGEWR